MAWARAFGADDEGTLFTEDPLASALRPEVGLFRLPINTHALFELASRSVIGWELPGPGLWNCA